MADARPVFERILDSSARIFGTTDLGIFTVDAQGQLHATAVRGNFARWTPGRYPRPLEGTISGKAIALGETVHWDDTELDPRVPDYMKAIGREYGKLRRHRVAVHVAGRRHRHAQHHAHPAAADHPGRARDAADVRGPGGGGDPERAALQRDAAVARPPDRHRRHPARDQRLAHGHPAGVQRDRRDRGALPSCDRAAFVRVEGDSYVPSAMATPAGLENDRWTEPVRIDPAASFPSQAIAWKRTVHIPDWDAIDLPERQKMVRADDGRARVGSTSAAA